MLFKEAYSILDRSTDLFSYNNLNFLKGRYLIIQGKRNEGIELCEKAIDIMRHFNKYQYVEFYSKLLDEYKQ